MRNKKRKVSSTQVFDLVIALGLTVSCSVSAGVTLRLVLEG